jgi:hypothetical protein
MTTIGGIAKHNTASRGNRRKIVAGNNGGRILMICGVADVAANAIDSVSGRCVGCAIPVRSRRISR